MMHSIAPDNGASVMLQLDGQGRIFRLRNALECIAAGRLLLQLKTSVPHGEFQGRAEALGLNVRTAQRYMTCARSFDPDRDAALLAAINSTGMLFELLCLEPVEIEALRLSGQVRGLTLESLPSMTVQQLRQTLRVHSAVSQEKHGKIVMLPARLARSLTASNLNAAQRPAESVATPDYAKPASAESIFLQLNEHGKIASLENAQEGLMAGRLLLQLRAVVPQDGKFKKRVNSLGVEYAAALQYMACARRFDSQRDAPLLAAARSVRKLLELLILNAEEIEALRLGGQVRGLTLESLPAMTVKQVQQALTGGEKKANSNSHLQPVEGDGPGRAIVRPVVSFTADEEDLLSNYRRCSLKARFHVAQAAELLAVP